MDENKEAEALQELERTLLDNGYSHKVKKAVVDLYAKH